MYTAAKGVSMNMIQRRPSRHKKNKEIKKNWPVFATDPKCPSCRQVTMSCPVQKACASHAASNDKILFRRGPVFCVP
jgi:hypothetical protein